MSFWIASTIDSRGNRTNASTFRSLQNRSQRRQPWFAARSKWSNSTLTIVLHLDRWWIIAGFSTRAPDCFGRRRPSPITTVSCSIRRQSPLLNCGHNVRSARTATRSHGVFQAPQGRTFAQSSSAFPSSDSPHQLPQLDAVQRRRSARQVSLINYKDDRVKINISLRKHLVSHGHDIVYCRLMATSWLIFVFIVNFFITL